MGDRMKCFQIVRIMGRNARCPEPVRWHGLHASPGAGSYRVFCCDEHVEVLADCLPTTVHGMRTVPKDPDVGTSYPRKDAHWGVVSDA